MAVHHRIAPATLVLLVTLASAQMTDEYQVKAGFVCSFASFVEWPPEVFKGPHDPLGICVLGRNPFGNTLETLARGKVVETRPLAVREIADTRQADGCQILFISSSEHLRLKSILDGLGVRSVFTIGDTGDFIAEGGVANLRLDNGHVRIEINADAARDRRLRVSSRLLQLAKNVKR